MTMTFLYYPCIKSFLFPPIWNSFFWVNTTSFGINTITFVAAVTRIQIHFLQMIYLGCVNLQIELECECDNSKLVIRNNVDYINIFGSFLRRESEKRVKLTSSKLIFYFKTSSFGPN